MKNKIFMTLMLLFVLSGFSLAQDNKQYFKVEADAIVRVKPDKAVVDVGVISKGKNLADTKKKNADIIKKTIEYCKKSGIPEKNIQTDYLSIRPEYKSYDTYETYFIIEQRLTIILEELSKYDEVLTELLNFGINQVNSINFQVNDLKKYRNEARKLAIAAAKERAEYLSKEVGIKLGNIVNMSDYTSNWYPRIMSATANIMSQNVSQSVGSQGSDSYDTLAPGMVSVKANIGLTYEIKK
jgi:uncharacterized protein YggE